MSRSTTFSSRYAYVHIRTGVTGPRKPFAQLTFAPILVQKRTTVRNQLSIGRENERYAHLIAHVLSISAACAIILHLQHRLCTASRRTNDDDEYDDDAMTRLRSFFGLF